MPPGSNPDLNWQTAFTAAQSDTCDDCVAYEPNHAAEESAPRGLAEFPLTDPAGGGGIGLWGFSGTSWEQITDYQALIPVPYALPDNIWICTDGGPAEVRSGPGRQYEVLARVRAESTVSATLSQLTSPQRPDGSDGEGWFLIEGDGINGRVWSLEVSGEEAGCGIWRLHHSMGS